MYFQVTPSITKKQIQLFTCGCAQLFVKSSWSWLIWENFHPRSLTLEIAMFKGSYLFQTIILRIHVSFRECNRFWVSAKHLKSCLICVCTLHRFSCFKYWKGWWSWCRALGKLNWKAFSKKKKQTRLFNFQQHSFKQLLVTFKVHIVRVFFLISQKTTPRENPFLRTHLDPQAPLSLNFYRTFMSQFEWLDLFRLCF